MWLGKMDRQVIFEQKVVTQDSVYGTEVISWIPFATVWANVQDSLPSKSESVLKGLAISINQVRIRTRYIPNLDSSMRVTVKGYSDRVLQIVGGPAELGRMQGIEIMCEDYSS